MKNNPPVASLELSKEIAKYVTLDTYFYYLTNPTNDLPTYSEDRRYGYPRISKEKEERERVEMPDGTISIIESIPAPLASEIGELLPEVITGYKYILIGRYKGKWVIQYEKINYSLQVIRFEDKTLVNAMCKMLIHLYKEELLKVEENK